MRSYFISKKKMVTMHAYRDQILRILLKFRKAKNIRSTFRGFFTISSRLATFSVLVSQYPVLKSIWYFLILATMKSLQFGK